MMIGVAEHALLPWDHYKLMMVQLSKACEAFINFDYITRPGHKTHTIWLNHYFYSKNNRTIHYKTRPWSCTVWANASLVAQKLNIIVIVCAVEFGFWENEIHGTNTKMKSIQLFQVCLSV